MNKKIKIVLTAALLTLSMSTTALAYKSPVDDLKNVLIEIGVPSNYIGNIVSYLQKIEVTDSQVSKVMEKVREAQRLIGNTKDLSSLPVHIKSELQKLAVQAGNIVGLNVKFGKNASGVTTVVVTTPNGGTLLQLNTHEIIGLVENFDMSLIMEAIEEIVDFANDPNKNDLDGDGKPDEGYKPEGGGSLNDTATPYGNMMFAGTSMIGMAGGIHFVSKKRK